MATQPRIYVQPKSIYVEAQSAPAQNRFAFAYTVTIHNLDRFDVQLLRRYWLITDANGKKLEVQGEGVVGEQPVITPNGRYQYTSGTLLETPIGTMQGYYEMKGQADILFRLEIPIFRLAIPNLIH